MKRYERFWSSMWTIIHSDNTKFHVHPVSLSAARVGIRYSVNQCFRHDVNSTNELSNSQTLQLIAIGLNCHSIVY